MPARFVVSPSRLAADSRGDTPLRFLSTSTHRLLDARHLSRLQEPQLQRRCEGSMRPRCHLSIQPFSQPLIPSAIRPPSRLSGTPARGPSLLASLHILLFRSRFFHAHVGDIKSHCDANIIKTKQLVQSMHDAVLRDPSHFRHDLVLTAATLQELHDLSEPQFWTKEPVIESALKALMSNVAHQDPSLMHLIDRVWRLLSIKRRLKLEAAVRAELVELLPRYTLVENMRVLEMCNRLKILSRDFCQVLARSIEGNIGSNAAVSDGDLLAIICFCVRSGILDTGFFDMATSRFVGHLSGLSNQALADLIWAFVCAERAAPMSVEMAEELLSRRLSSFAPSEFARLAVSLAKFDPGAPQLRAMAVQVIETDQHQYSDQDLADVIWSMSTLQIQSPALWTILLAKLRSRLGNIEADALSKVAWSLAHMRMNPNGIFSQIATASMVRLPEFSGDQLSVLLYSFATMRIRADTLFDSALPWAIRKLPSLDDCGLSNLLWAYSSHGIKAPELFEQALPYIHDRLPHFDAKTLKSIIVNYGYQRPAYPDLFDAASKHILSHVSEYPVGDLTMIALAYASHSIASPQLFKEISRMALPKLARLSEKELALNLIWSFAKLDIRDRPLFDQAARVIASRINSYSTRSLAVVAWSFATVGIPAPTLFAKLASASIPVVHRFRNEELILMLLWSFAKLKIRSEPLFLAGSDHLVKNMASMPPALLPLIVWCYATLKVDSPILFFKVADAVLPYLDDLSPGQLSSSLLWAFAKLRIPSPRLFAEAADAILTNIENYPLRNLANVSWCYATMETYNPALFGRLSELILPRIDSVCPQTLSIFVWSHAKLKQHNPPLFEAASRIVCRNADEMSIQQLALLAWSYSQMSIDDPELFRAIQASYTKRLYTLLPYQISEVIFALGRQHQAFPYSSLYLDREFSRQTAAVARLKWSRFQFTDCVHLLRGYQWLGFEAEDVTWLRANTSPQVVERLSRSSSSSSGGGADRR